MNIPVDRSVPKFDSATSELIGIDAGSAVDASPPPQIQHIAPTFKDKPEPAGRS